MKLLLRTLSLILLSTLHADAAAPLNVADPKMHPYADPAGGREGHSLSGAKVNEARLYDFYRRQADYYMARGNTPRLLPAHPGLDAGLHGHWGKHAQNEHEDGRWNQQDFGSLVAAHLHVGKTTIFKAVNLKLGQRNELSACFDPWTLTYRLIWRDGFIEFHPYRWGVSRGAQPQGEVLLSHSGSWKKNRPSARITDSIYRGFYRHGKRTTFSYEVGGLKVLDHPWQIKVGNTNAFVRSLRVSGQLSGTLPLAELPKAETDRKFRRDHTSGIVRTIDDQAWIVAVYAAKDTARLLVEGEQIRLGCDPTGQTIVVRLIVWKGDPKDTDAALDTICHLAEPLDPAELIGGGQPQWPQRITLPGVRSDEDRPYVIDTLPIPVENPFRSVMMLSGIDFLPSGEALVCTLSGDVWLVSGIDDSLQSVTWKRFAAGLHQPFGIKYDDGNIFILAKDQLHLLKDLNADGEADFYQNYDNSYLENHSHTHAFGLDRDRQGNFYFPAYDLFYKLPPDGSGVRLIARGFRNCMGVAVNDDGLVLAAPQEGTWTPASMIIEVREGEHYGFQRVDEPISPPMCFIPRGIDNSTGGMVFVNSDRWGPLGKSLIGLSYGYGSHYLILRDQAAQPAQGAVVPLEGDFLSGVNRGRIRTQDGQLYVVGCDGWGNYALEDGCFQRVRYTGKPVHQPIGFQIHENGIRVDFPAPLDRSAAENLRSYFCQQWNYEHSKRYGSPEMSVWQPHQLGHDRVRITSARLLDNRSSIFVEIPRLVPCYQLHLRMHLKAASGETFKTDIFPTILRLGSRYEFDGALPSIKNRPTRLALRIREEKQIPLKHNEPQLQTTRTIQISALPGIRYDRTTIAARAGEAVGLQLRNEDSMPHNLVIVQPGAYEKVGMLSFKMLNDPTAFDRHYVPDVPEIVAHTRVVFPGETSTIKFRMPDKPGRYPFLCTFPGHWQTMTGQLIVVGRSEPLPENADESLDTLERRLLSEPLIDLIEDARRNGSADRGAALFYKKEVSCATCHDPRSGPRLGPDLAEQREGVNDEYLVHAVLQPSKDIRQGFEPVTVMTVDGIMRTGVKVRDDEDTVALRDLAAGGELLEFQRQNLDKVMLGKTSMMPAGLANHLANRAEFVDLLRFLIEVSEGGERRLRQLRDGLSG